MGDVTVQGGKRCSTGEKMGTARRIRETKAL